MCNGCRKSYKNRRDESGVIQVIGKATKREWMHPMCGKFTYNFACLTNIFPIDFRLKRVAHSITISKLIYTQELICAIRAVHEREKDKTMSIYSRLVARHVIKTTPIVYKCPPQRTPIKHIQIDMKCSRIYTRKLSRTWTARIRSKRNKRNKKRNWNIRYRHLSESMRIPARHSSN